jgi:hypothetical protein
MGEPLKFPGQMKDPDRKKTSADDVYKYVATEVNKHVAGDRARAIARVKQELFWEGEGKVYTDADSVRLCEQMVIVIKWAPLVVNFNAEFFWKALVDPRRDYANVFQMDDRGVKCSKGREYVRLRNDIESEVFGLHAHWGKDDGVDDIAMMGKKLDEKSGLNIPKGRQDWSVATSNPKFKSTLRPRYAMANFARTLSGPKTWGKSYLELYDDAKRNATYIAQDSFGALLMKIDKEVRTTGLWSNNEYRMDAPPAGDLVATSENMYRVILHMPGPLFRAVRDTAEGKVTKFKPYDDLEKKYELEQYHYIEVHYFGEVHLVRDVRKIVLSQSELARDPKGMQAIYEKANELRSLNLIWVP